MKYIKFTIPLMECRQFIYFCRLIVIAFISMIQSPVMAMSSSTVVQEQDQHGSFCVASFRSLDNDVTAFFSPVFDRAGDACALVRVVGSSDFAFSTPLGIVKRTDLTGEILLYLPKGTKTLTIKHPQWGVIRDYNLGTKLASQQAYELRLTVPSADPVVQHDTITQTIMDTVTIVKIIDTKKERLPLSKLLVLSLGIHPNGPSAGIMLSIMRRHGVFVSGQWNMRTNVNTSFDCDDNGMLTDGTIPYYTGETRCSAYTITTGAIHRLSSVFSVYEGIGYGSSQTSWRMVPDINDNDIWVRNTQQTHRGIAATVGTLMTINPFTASLGVTTIATRIWYFNLGIGIRI